MNDGSDKIAVKNGFIMVDPEDRTKFNPKNIIIHGKQVLIITYTPLHKIIYPIKRNGKGGVGIYFKNKNFMDLRKSNLEVRDASTRSMGMLKTKSLTSSKYKGVHWRTCANKWRSVIQKNNRKYSVGLFDDEVIAAKAYDTMAIKLFGKYAQLNFPQSQECERNRHD